MTFTEHYAARCGAKGERPMEWLQEIAVVTGMTVDAAYQWGIGCRTPNPAAQRFIAEALGESIEELFPNTKKTRQ